MSQELLRDARSQAERLEPAVRSAALCHIARVLTRSDPAEARRVLEEGLALAAGLPGEEERGILLAEGAVLAATIAPARAFEIFSTLTGERRHVLDQILARMADHGFRAEATAYLLDAPLDGEFLFGMAMHVTGPSDDLEIKRRMLRRAIAAMRETDAGRQYTPPFGARDFVQFFVYQWRLLPVEEAREAIRDHVRRILSEADSPINASFEVGSERVTFTSTHQARLFEILEPLQELDPDLAASTIPRYRELSAVAWRFPYGRRSMSEQMEREAAASRGAGPPPVPDACMDYVGSTPIEDALRTDFAQPFAIAMDEYDRDADPDDYNEVPQQCWPSAAAFRTILYKAGEYQGAAAARYLDRIPDPALRLFAQIELAAALAGLPQLGSTTMRRGSRARRRMTAGTAQAASRALEIPAGPRPLPSPQKPDLPPSRELRISPATARADEGTSGGSGGDFVEIRNASLLSVVSHLFRMPPPRIEWPASIDPTARYDFVLVLANDASDEERWRLVREGVASHFGVQISIEPRPRDVWVLTAPNGIKARARRTPRMAGFGSMGSSWIGISSREMSESPRPPDAVQLQQILRAPQRAGDVDPSEALEDIQREMARALGALGGSGVSIDGVEGELSMPELCSMLEPGLDRPLVDETGLGGRYVIAFESDDPEGFLQVLTRRLGLVVSEGHRTVSTLVVRR